MSGRGPHRNSTKRLLQATQLACLYNAAPKAYCTVVWCSMPIKRGNALPHNLHRHGLQATVHIVHGACACRPAAEGGTLERQPPGCIQHEQGDAIMKCMLHVSQGCFIKSYGGRQARRCLPNRPRVLATAKDGCHASAVQAFPVPYPKILSTEQPEPRHLLGLLVLWLSAAKSQAAQQYLTPCPKCKDFDSKAAKGRCSTSSKWKSRCSLVEQAPMEMPSG